MKKTFLFFSVATLAATAAFAQPSNSLDVKVTGIDDGKPIPSKFAYCMPDGKGKTTDGGNVNPAISWSGAPAGTKSYALLVVDRDVPGDFDLANQSGKTITQDYPRQNFYHWVLINIPTSVTGIAEGQDSQKVVAGGKPPGQTDYGLNGLNDYSPFMKGNYGGYDGPCPPWNDERLHHYHFIVYALDIPSIDVKDNFTGKEVENALALHVLAKGEVVGTYTDNPGRGAE